MIKGIDIINPVKYEKLDEYKNEIYHLRQRKGMTRRRAANIMKRENYFGSMMVHMGDADGLISGITQNYDDTLRPALQIIQTCENRSFRFRKLDIPSYQEYLRIMFPALFHQPAILFQDHKHNRRYYICISA